MRNHTKIYKLLPLLLAVFYSSTLLGQYVHPNQAGRKGGDTGAGLGKQVITSTYLGNAGNAAAQGVIMSVNKDGSNAATFHEFKGFSTDGSYPFYTTPVQTSDGNLYGSSFLGGTSNQGAVYKYGIGTGVESVIYNNTGGGGNYANINELSDGKIYVPHTYGGANNLGGLYRMDKNGSNAQLIHSFSSIVVATYTTAATAQVNAGFSKYDGAYPYGFVVEGLDGKIYGSCFAGGAYNVGAYYRCNKDGTSYEIINVGDPNYKTYENGRGGQIAKAWNMYNSWGNVAIDQTGKVYVTGYYGGAGNIGGQARMDADGSNYQILHSGNASEGSYPYRGALIIDDKIYGTFRYGGPNTLSGGVSYGSVYSMNLDGTDYKILKGFDNTAVGYLDGTEPWSGLSYDGTFLYGTTLVNGGAGVVGTIFKVKPNGNDFQTIHRFKNSVAPSCTVNGVTTVGAFAYYPSAERVTFGDVSLIFSKNCIANLSCTAGTAAPTLTKTTLTNDCPSTTADLTNIGVSNIPVNSEIEWHSATPISATNKVANPNAVTAGTYYAVFYDAVNGCYGNSGAATTPVTVTIVTCCPAGNYAPPLTTNKISNTCPTTTVDLTSLQIGTAPSGSVVTWHTSATVSAANKVATPTTASTTGGPYYAAYFNSGSSCYSPASGAVAVTNISCTAVNKSNICPAVTYNLMSILTSTPPTNTVLKWKTSAGVVVADPTQAVAGTYYPVYYDATNDCYGGTGTPVTVAVNVCGGVVLNAGSASQSATTNQAKSGNAATELAPSGGTGTYTYSNGSSDPLCIAPIGAMALPGTSNLIVNSNGTYTYTAPAVAGTYYFCVKVCDNTSPTPICAVQAYTITVAAPGAIAFGGPSGGSPTQTTNTNQAKSGNAATDLLPAGGTAPYNYSNGSSDPLCIAPVGATALPALSNLVINANGTYTYTAPATAGTYYFCVKVCDSTSPTAVCNVAVYTITVNAVCAAGSVAPNAN